MQAAESFEFHGQELVVITDEAGERWVATKPVCRNIGIYDYNQQQRLVNSPQFSCHVIMAVGSECKSGMKPGIRIVPDTRAFERITRNK